MQSFTQRCLVLSANNYRIEDEKTGEVNSGLTVFYIPSDNLGEMVDVAAHENGRLAVGMQPSKAVLPYDATGKIIKAPALYDITFKMVTRQLKTQVVPDDMQYLGEVEMQLKKSEAKVPA